MNIGLHELIVPEVKKVGVYAIRNKRTNENGYNNPSHSPTTNGYFAENELIFCRKPQPKKLNRIDIQSMTNRQLLNFYKNLSSYGHVKTDNFLFAENELLKRLDIRKN